MAETDEKPQSALKRVRATAIKHALNIEEKKKLANRVSDLVLQAYDIPTTPDADPARPSKSDALLFSTCLELFRPSDLDELVSERNIDGRCGYALCPEPHRKIPGAGIKTWNRKGGKDFKLLRTADLEKWCSDFCNDRTAFVRAQLSPEPAWMRESQNEVKLLDDVLRAESVDDLASAIRTLVIDQSSDAKKASRLQELSRERGESETKDVSDQVPVVERQDISDRTTPPKPGTDDNVEGHKTKAVRFADSAI